jgi:hypothetical protein
VRNVVWSPPEFTGFPVSAAFTAPEQRSRINEDMMSHCIILVIEDYHPG